MYINLSDILNYEGAKKELDLTLNIKDINIKDETFPVKEPIKVKGSINNSNDHLYLNAKVSSKLGIECSRCAEPMIYNLEFDMVEILKKETEYNDSDDDSIIIKGYQIEIENIIIKNIVFNFPMKVLCSEDCKGLCNECGTNLNHNSCNCENNNLDPRLEVLKDYFK